MAPSSSVLARVLATEFDIPLVAERMSKEQDRDVSDLEIREACLEELKTDPTTHNLTIKAFMMMNLMQMMGDIKMHAAASMAAGLFTPTETIKLLELINQGLLTIADGPSMAPTNNINVFEAGGSVVDLIAQRLSNYQRPQLIAPDSDDIVEPAVLNDRVRFGKST